MKILHIISQMPDMTGSGKYLQALLNLARQNGHDNLLVAGIQNGFTLDSRLIDPANTLYVTFNIPELNFFIPGMSDVMPYPSTVFSRLTPVQLDKYETAFKKVIYTAVKKFKPDIIHSHHLWLVSAFAAEVAPSVPLVVSCHGTCLRQLSLCPHLKKKPIMLSKNVSKIMALSQIQKQEIENTYSDSKGKIEVVGAGFDNRLFSPGKKNIPPPVELLYAGKLSRSKGVPWLLESLKSLQSMPWRLHLAGGGTGQEKKQCMELAAWFGNQVVVHGPLSHPDLAALMKSAHVFILPSFYEGLPLVLMEALASGCCIITTSLPGTREVMKKTMDGRIVLVDLPELATVDAPHASDLPFLEKTLAKILANTIETFMKKEVPPWEKADSIIEACTWERVFERIEIVYAQALRG